MRCAPTPNSSTDNTGSRFGRGQVAGGSPMVGDGKTRLTGEGGPGSSFFGQAAGWGGWSRGASIYGRCPSPFCREPRPATSEACCRGPKGRPARSRLDAGRPGGTLAGSGSSARQRLLTVRKGPRRRVLVLQACSETFPGDAASVAAGIRAHCLASTRTGSRACPGGGVGVYWAA